jgi:hypothetical protein
MDAREDVAATVSAQEHEIVLASWRARIFRSFPEQTARFLERETDPFRNPIGERIRLSSEQLLDGVLRGCAPGDLHGAADGLVRVRAVQGGRPSAALECVFLLKCAMRQAIGERRAAAFDTRIDALALVAFDAFIRCREEIHEIRVRESQRRVALLMRRFSDACLPPEEDVDLADRGGACCTAGGGQSR